MFSSQSAELSLESPCRVVAPVSADRVDNRFLVGTSLVPRRNPLSGNTITDNNYLYACRFHAEVNELGIDGVFTHPTGPIQSIACSPTDATLVATSSQLKNNATLWKLAQHVMEEAGGMQYDPEEAGTDALGSAPSASMEALSTLESSSGNPISHMAWRQPSLLETEDPASMGSASAGDLLTVDQQGTVQRWNVEMETAVSVSSTASDKKEEDSNSTSRPWHMGPRVAWDPHAGGNAAAVTTRGRNNHGGGVRIFDWRTDQSIPVGNVDHFTAHPAGGSTTGVLDMDYNPNKPHVLATAGTDGLIKFWDLRMSSQQHDDSGIGSSSSGSRKRQHQPLLVCRGAHSHWVYNVCYNPFHDQLVLSTGTADTLANLWRISSISSAPSLLDDPAEQSGADKRVASHEHADAVYGAAWGAADAWVYTTVGYDGKMVLHHVPSKEKYKILL